MADDKPVCLALRIQADTPRGRQCFYRPLCGVAHNAMDWDSAKTTCEGCLEILWRIVKAIDAPQSDAS